MAIQAKRPPEWLAPPLAEWAASHVDVLDSIYDRFEETGEWPDPMQLQREMRAAGGPQALARTASAMPRELGHRDHSSPRVVLTLFGVACCQASGRLLNAYFTIFALALARHSTPTVNNRVTRGDINALLNDPLLTDRVSRLILADCPFLAGGSADLEEWDLAIDERIVDYEDAGDPNELLAAIAGERGLVALPPQPDSSPPDIEATPPASADVGPGPSGPEAHTRLRNMLATVATIVGVGLGVAVASLPLGLAAVSAFLATIAVLLWRPGVSTGQATVSILAVATLGAVVGLLLDSSDPPPLTAQLDAIVAQADDEGQYPADRRTIQLHADSPRSHLFVLEDESDRPGGIPREFASPPSAEVRIYDEADGRLDLRMRFHPQNHGQVEQGPDGDAPGFQFRIIDIDDFDKNGTVEIVAAFDRISFATGSLPIPVIVSWDSEDAAYDIHPLLTQPPRLRVSSRLASAAYAGYSKPTLVQDQLSDKRLTGYPADVIAVRQGLRGPILMAAYPELSERGFTGRYEAKGWFLDLSGGSPRLARCSPSEHLFLRVSSPAEVTEALPRALIGPANEPGCGQA